MKTGGVVDQGRTGKEKQELAFSMEEKKMRETIGDISIRFRRVGCPEFRERADRIGMKSESWVRGAGGSLAGRIVWETGAQTPDSERHSRTFPNKIDTRKKYRTITLFLSSL